MSTSMIDHNRIIKTSLERGFRLSLLFFIMVSSLHFVDLNNFLRNFYIIMYGSAHCVLSQSVNRDLLMATRRQICNEISMEVDASHRSSPTTPMSTNMK